MHEKTRDGAARGSPPEARVGDRLKKLRHRHFVGRHRELAQLEQCRNLDGPAVTFLHGIGGMGKSALLEVLEVRLRARGVRTLRLDARGVEPTRRGFLEALARQLGLRTHHGEVDIPDLDSLSAKVTAALANALGITVLLIDHCELLRLLDSWLSADFVPHLSERVRLVLAGRHPPTGSWSAAAGWQTLVQSCALQALSQAESRELLVSRQAPAALVAEIVNFAQGHPVALELALAAAAERARFDFEASDRSGVLARLAQLFLRDLEETELRAALEASCVVRRASRSFLATLLGPEAATRAMGRLGELGFVERTAEGLSLHPSVRQALEGELRAIDPIRHRELRRAAWQHMRGTLPSVGRAHLWQHAADALFLLEQDHIREAFFPSGHARFAVERAREADWAEIAAISGAYDSPEGVSAIEAFLQYAGHAVHVARSEDREVVAFYVLSRNDQIPESLLARDPLIAQWVLHHPTEGAPALFLRRLLAHPAHAARAEAYAACVLDLKRSYIENPRTTRLYAARSDPSAHPEWGPLGFQEHPELSAQGLAINGGTHSTACLEFGAGGIFGWIGRLVDAQYQLPAEFESAPPSAEPAPNERLGVYLDEGLRELVIDGAAVSVTPLQFNLLRYFSSHSARVIDRDELVRAVWGRAFVGSNVVDASIRSLRKKLGRHANSIETIKGFGYRFRAPPST